VFPLAVNYLDRVLSVLTVRRSQLQLLAAVCMFIASKFKDTTPLSAHCLVVYTDCSITMSDLLVRILTVHQQPLTILRALTCLTVIDSATIDTAAVGGGILAFGIHR